MSARAPRRILILANEAIGDEGLVEEIVRHTEGPGSEEPAPQTPPGGGEEAPEEDEDARVDRDAEETFPASDPPANY